MTRLVITIHCFIHNKHFNCCDFKNIVCFRCWVIWNVLKTHRSYQHHHNYSCFFYLLLSNLQMWPTTTAVRRMCHPREREDVPPPRQREKRERERMCQLREREDVPPPRERGCATPREREDVPPPREREDVPPPRERGCAIPERERMCHPREREDVPPPREIGCVTPEREMMCHPERERGCATPERERMCHPREREDVPPPREREVTCHYIRSLFQQQQQHNTKNRQALNINDSLDIEKGKKKCVTYNTCPITINITRSK